MPDIPVVKDETREGPIPTAWRGSLKRIADALTSGDLPLGDGIREMSPTAARTSFAYVANHPVKLGPLAESAWTTSVCIWMRDHWDCLIDLLAIDGARTDLVWQIRVYEVGDRVEYAPHLIYVP